MLRIAVACLALSAGAQEPASRATWMEVERDGSPPLRYLVRELPAQGAEPRAQDLLFLVPPPTRDRADLEHALDGVLDSGVLGAGWVVASSTDPRESFAAVVLHLDGGSGGAARRVHLVGWLDGASEALLIASAAPDRVASVVALAPTALGPAELERLDALANTPVALLRGRDDERGPLLAVSERLIAAGGDTLALGFASAVGHALPRDCEGRLREYLSRFRAAERERAAVELAVRTRLEQFHQAASKADGASYFACFAPDGIFIGTDASERWTVAQFRAYCEPYFSQGQGWTYRASERHVYLSRDRASAWFDERLANDKYGEVRGSGVLREDAGTWRITQYVMSFPVPNELSAELVRMSRERKR